MADVDSNLSSSETLLSTCSNSSCDVSSRDVPDDCNNCTIGGLPPPDARRDSVVTDDHQSAASPSSSSCPPAAGFIPILHSFSACSGVGRVMCHYSRSITSKDISLGSRSLNGKDSTPQRPPLAGAASDRRSTSQGPTAPADLVIARPPAHMRLTKQADLSSMAEPPHHDFNGTPRPVPTPSRQPSLSHRMKHDKSILALALSASYIFAGTQGGEILVYSLDTYEPKKVIEAHRGSVLGLCLSQDQELLFSSATDPFVNVWSTTTFLRLYAIWSTYDVGDIFCVAYSSYHKTVYLGAQNASIQWYDLKEKDSRPRPALTSHPSERVDRFFDSAGPGGVRTPRPTGAENKLRDAVGGQNLEIDKQDVCTFAHYGYVYCMLLGQKILPDSPAEEVLVSGGGDGRIQLWRIDPSSGGAISKIYTLEDGREEGESILSLAREGSFLYSGRLDGEVNVWDLETRQLVRNLKASTGDVLSLTFGGGLLFAGGIEGTVQKFNQHYETVSTFQAHDGLILASAFTNYNHKPTFVTGGNDSTIVIWSIQDCEGPSSTPRRNNNDLMVESLNQFISFRTVSSLPKYRADCRRGASFLRSVFQNFGAATEMLNTTEPYNPIVFAKFRGNPATASSRKKILFYGHYDVIPAEDEANKWKHDPFTLTGEGGYLYGRGISDNKGPIMAAIYAAHELANEQSLDSDIIFLIEGEEESGSRGFKDAIRAKKDLIGDVDWILLANSYWLDDHVPCITYGLRGVIHATVQIESRHPDLHSGVDGSALLDEPLKDLVMLLSKLTGPHGKVLIPGFYDPILPLTADEKQLYAEITETLLRGNPDLGDPEELAQSLMRRWREASLTIHRFQTSGPDNSTIIPRLAKASISIRLVPNQEISEVAESMTSYLSSEFAQLDSKNALTVTIDHQAEPWLGDYTNEIFQTLESAIQSVWGPTLNRRRSSIPALKSPDTALSPLSPAITTTDHRPSPTTSNTLANSSSPTTADTEAGAPSTNQDTTAPSTLARKPLYIREGGSIPSIRFLEKEFDAPAAHLPCGQASDSAHLDNERLRLVNLYNSKRIFKKVFRELPRK
ncbi:glutathione degradosome [Aaosphaeria arxii CBS 175.79]|uniref:Glutathione degradosome n=1 Tax=Aaosphaeria arxii CBS 175.79 TaxID=1450172 RepID=A0A6A5XA27_9PLEO|nr:glutathione degradosome [Aaosphaeria arxii CBS 175.79]KAF2009706.1 glutathione degradosome [Aaosphaeria arxii CBS 175.79]